MSDAKSTLIQQLLDLADAFSGHTGQTKASIAKAIFGRGGHFDDLEAGKRDLATGTFERAIGWFSINWPSDLSWPAGFVRPEQSVEAA